ncbi:hypothetical protein BJ508DRAFT_331872 [Ascobolus immersus RN42]|uniref:Uncharacterized protein n=1 Tax=Ascobolus immersus RN42 TaxID=1160509 RepID=A0A3N4HUK8_ASCIM|nr:hypothetical protein BJ508DRAFT_331872 [Ascobolus immersus RN42]
MPLLDLFRSHKFHSPQSSSGTFLISDDPLRTPVSRSKVHKHRQWIAPISSPSRSSPYPLEGPIHPPADSVEIRCDYLVKGDAILLGFCSSKRFKLLKRTKMKGPVPHHPPVYLLPKPKAAQLVGFDLEIRRFCDEKLSTGGHVIPDATNSVLRVLYVDLDDKEAPKTGNVWVRRADGKPLSVREMEWICGFCRNVRDMMEKELRAVGSDEWTWRKGEMVKTLCTPEKFQEFVAEQAELERKGKRRVKM